VHWNDRRHSLGFYLEFYVYLLGMLLKRACLESISVGVQRDQNIQKVGESGRFSLGIQVINKYKILYIFVI